MKKFNWRINNNQKLGQIEKCSERCSTRLNLTFVFILLAFFMMSCAERTPQQANLSKVPFYKEATFTPHWFAPNAPELDDFHQISPFQLVNQEGKVITEKTFTDKIYIVDFFFTTCPGICPKMTKNLGVLQDQFMDDEDVLLLSHSVTPEKDSVPILKNYAKEHGVIAGKWHLATGTQEEIYKLGRADYFVEEDLGETKKMDEFLHTENFVLLDYNRRIRGIYNGLNLASLTRLYDDVKLLQEEK